MLCCVSRGYDDSRYIGDGGDKRSEALLSTSLTDIYRRSLLVISGGLNPNRIRDPIF